LRTAGEHDADRLSSAFLLTPGRISYEIRGALSGSAKMDKIAISLIFTLTVIICLTVFHMADGKF
jgi:hypothetical protein